MNNDTLYIKYFHAQIIACFEKLSLSQQHLQALDHLLTIGHLKKLEEFIEKLPEHLGETAQFLRQKINQYDFEGIKKALKEHEKKISQSRRK